MNEAEGTPAERRVTLVQWLLEQGADPIEVMDAGSVVPSRPEWRDYIYRGTPFA